MNKKICILLFTFCFFSLNLWARAGDSMYVNVKETVLKSGTGFFASEIGSIPYGTQVKILEEKGKWVKVEKKEDSSVTGWVPLSSLTKKKIILNEGLFSIDASADEIALAGKGFSAEVEELYSGSSLASFYSLVDGIEEKNIEKDTLLEFILEGQLSGASEWKIEYFVF
mgnify:CR=1 FL=1